MHMPRKYRLSWAVLTVAAALVACSSYQHEPHRLGPAAQLDNADYTLRFVEADDNGWFWDKSQAAGTMDLIRASAARMDTFVIVFVHGWHHSAECCDGNVEGFKETLGRLHDELSKKMYETARNTIQHGPGWSPQFRLIGVYIGWRGSSLPGLADYATFFGRKASAERVGETDLREFLIRLNGMYLEQQTPKPGNASRAFLGLVTVGHSFGGQAVLRAVSSTLEGRLEDLNPTPAFLRGSAPAAPQPAAHALQGIGDMVILVNPAVEAAAYQRLHVLSQGLTYGPEQTPVLVTFSAENDGARHGLFRAGRIAGEILGRKPHIADPVEREMERQSLGVYGENATQNSQVTHRLIPVDPTVLLNSTKISHPRDPLCHGPASCEMQWYA
jgi:hypothetical protein